MDEEVEDVEVVPTETKITPVLAGLRWLAMVPGALVSSFIATFPIHWLLMLLYYLKSSGSPDDAFMTQDGKPVPFFGIPPETLERLGYAAILPAVFVLVGTYIAPTRKWTTAVLLAVAWVIMLTAVVTWAATTETINVELSISNGLAVLLNLASLGFALRAVHEDHG